MPAKEADCMSKAGNDSIDLIEDLVSRRCQTMNI